MAKAKKKPDYIQAVSNKLKLNFAGMTGGLIFFCLSFTPSLLPRGYVLQGVAAGLSFTTGYGLAVALSHIYHRLVPKKHQPTIPPRAKQITVGLLLLIAIASIFLGYNWQQEVRQITEAASESHIYPFRVILIATGLSALLIWLGRCIRKLGHWCSKQFNRILGPKVSAYLGVLGAAIILIFLVNGVILRGAFGVINFTFGLANKSTPAGIYQPQNNLYSGSPASAIDWNSLGEKGREFVATAPTQASIEKFSGAGQSAQPSRLYVGLQSAPTLDERVKLLIKELDRTKAANRQAVLIAIPTGSGGINAKSIQTVEYLNNGNTTTLGIQYSYLPSWLSFLADQEVARQNGKVLVEAVYNWWNNLDPAKRPKLLMYGESLGTLGADGAFSGVSDMQNRMSGVLLVGPPNANNLWEGIVGSRDEGSREVLPVYQKGKVVRFTDGTKPLGQLPADQPWDDNRVGFIQHASDPVVWGSLSLLVQKPDWLDETRGSDVSPNMRWYPFVTAWQVALDLPFAFGATPGHGHRYGESLTAGWEAVLNANLTNEKSEQLQQIIDQVKG